MANATQLGIDCKFYRNTSNTNTPTWVLCEDLRDVTVSSSHAEVDVSTRRTSFKQYLAGITDLSIEAELIENKASSDSVADFAALYTAFTTKAPIECAVLDGASNTVGTRGLRAFLTITKFDRAEPLEGAMTHSLTFKPALASAVPTWMEVSN